MKHISVLIKPASSLCNLRCKYCFYADVSDLREIKSFGIMEETVMNELIDSVYSTLEDEDHITFMFQGGEPTIAGIEYFEKFIEYVKFKNNKVKVHYAIQTNGTLINEEWCEFFKENDFLVGLSIDCGSNFHNTNRIDTNKKGTYTSVIKTKKLFDKYSIEYNVLCVLTNDIARYPKKVFKFILENKIKYIQFIPCLDDLNSIKRTEYALKPERFASFYKEIYTLWENEYKKGNYISIGLIDNIYNLISKGTASTCGMLGKCAIQYVIESDGCVYPCDFYVLDEYSMGNITKSNLLDLFNSEKAQAFLKEEKKLSEMCNRCKYIKICQGGCKRMKNSMYINDDETYCGYMDTLSFIGGRLSNIN